jgi:multiple sugar transport system substrate-binding protein
MNLGSPSQKITRRGILRGAGLLAAVSALPLLQACAAPAAVPTAVPAAPAAPAPTQAPQVVTKEVTSVVTQVVEKPVQVVVTATPVAGALSSIKINGNLQIIQQRGFNPLQTTYIHNLLIKTAAANNWPLDISYEEAFTGGGNFFEKMAATVASGDPADFFFGAEDTFQLWNQKSLVPVDDLVQWAVKQYGDPVPGQKLGNFVDGKWYGVPFFSYTGGYFVRKSWFDAIGVDINKQMTLQEWLDACVKVSDPATKKWGWGNTVNRSGDGQTNVYSPLWQAGARVSSEDNKVTFNSPETIAAYEWLKELYGTDKYAKALPTGVNAWGDSSNNEAYLAGTIGFSSNAGTMFATAMIKAPEIAKDSWLALSPSGPVGKKESLIVAGPGYFQFQMFQGAKNPDAARALIQLLLSKENQKAVWDNSPGHSIPAYAWGWDEPELAKVPNNVIKVSKEMIQSDTVFKMFLPQKQPKLWINAFDTEVVATDVMADILKGTPVKDAVAAGHAKTQKIWDKFQGK